MNSNTPVFLGEISFLIRFNCYLGGNLECGTFRSSTHSEEDTQWRDGNPAAYFKGATRLVLTMLYSYSMRLIQPWLSLFTLVYQ